SGGGGAEAEIAEQSELGKPLRLMLADLGVARNQAPLGGADVGPLLQQCTWVADRDRFGQPGQRARACQLGIERTRLFPGQYGELVQRFADLRIQRDEGLLRILDLSPDALDVEIGGDALRPALLRECQNLFLEVR